MPTPPDLTRPPRLRAARKRFKAGESVPQQDLAKVYGVSNARLTTLIKQRFEGFPLPERHGDKTHWYDAHKAIDSMLAYLSGTGAKKRQAAARAAEIVGDVKVETESTPVAPDPDKREPLTPAELDRLASAETRTFRLEQEKRQFIRIEIARGYVRSLFNAVQRAVSALPVEIDPNGELPPLQRQRLEMAVRDSMVRIHGTVEDLIEVEAPADRATAA